MNKTELITVVSDGVGESYPVALTQKGKTIQALDRNKHRLNVTLTLDINVKRRSLGQYYCKGGC